MNRVVAGCLALMLNLAVPAGAQTSATLYQDGRVLVRRQLPLAVPRGVSSHRLELGALEPASLFLLDSTMSLVGTAYQEATDADAALRRAVGRRLTFRRDTALVQATVLSVAPERYGLADGSITFQRPGIPLFPAELIALEPTTLLTVNSRGAARMLAVGYFTRGGGWQADYTVVLGAQTARVTGLASLRPGTLALDSAELQLLAGDVGDIGTMGDDAPATIRRRAMGFAVAEAKAAPEQAVGEAHVYTLPGRHTLTPGRTTAVALFEPATPAYRKRYQVEGGLPYRGSLAQFGEEQELPVTVAYLVPRARKTELGDRPLPGGGVRLYQADDAGRLHLIGATSIGHSPAGEALELQAGSAFDLTARRTQTTYQQVRDGRTTVATADYRVILTNATDTAVTIDVAERHVGDWAVLASSVPAERVSSSRVRFRVSVPARGEAELTYRVRVRW